MKPPSPIQEHTPGTAARIMVTLAAFVVIIAGMKAAETILVPFLLSVFIAVISAPALFWLQSHKVPKVLALLIIIGVILGFITLIALLVGNSLDDFTQNLPLYREKLLAKMNQLLNWLEKWPWLQGRIPDDKFLSHFDPGVALSLIGKLVNSLGAILTNTFLIVLTTTFILLEASSFPAKLHAITGNSSRTVLAPFQKFFYNIMRYVEIKTWTSLMTGALVAMCLSFIRVDFALLWGTLAFLLNYVPNIGSFIAAIPAVLLALIQLGLWQTGFVIVAYAVINGVIGNILEPRFMGQGLGLSPLVVFLSLLFWGWVMGPIGMLLSVPLTMTIQIALESKEETRWLAILLGGDIEVPKKP